MAPQPRSPSPLQEMPGKAGAARTLALRRAVFGDGPDAHDATARHLIVTGQGEAVIAACRYWLHPDLAAARAGYTGALHDLTRLPPAPFPWIEVGRLCSLPDSPDGLRLVRAGLARAALTAGAGRLFGCSSFPSADPHRHQSTLDWLSAHHGRESRGPAAAPPPGLPPLLRSYLALGAWVAPEVVSDPALDTCHVLTVLDLAAIDPARRRAFAALAATVPVDGAPLTA